MPLEQIVWEGCTQLDFINVQPPYRLIPCNLSRILVPKYCYVGTSLRSKDKGYIYRHIICSVNNNSVSSLGNPLTRHLTTSLHYNMPGLSNTHTKKINRKTDISFDTCKLWFTDQ